MANNQFFLIFDQQIFYYDTVADANTNNISNFKDDFFYNNSLN